MTPYRDFTSTCEMYNLHCTRRNERNRKNISLDSLDSRFPDAEIMNIFIPPSGCTSNPVFQRTSLWRGKPKRLLSQQLGTQFPSFTRSSCPRNNRLVVLATLTAVRCDTMYYNNTIFLREPVMRTLVYITKN